MRAFCHKNLMRASSWAAINLCALVTVQPSFAQTVAGDEARMDVVTVTTQKREEAITDVPIAITAFQAEDLTTLRATTLDQLAFSPQLGGRAPAAAPPEPGGGGPMFHI